MKELVNDPYGLPLPSFQGSDAVSVRLPSGWLPGTGKCAAAAAVPPGSSVGGTPDTVPDPPGTVSTTVIEEAVTPPMLESVSGLSSVVPASTVCGPPLAMVRIGTFSTVVTELEVA